MDNLINKANVLLRADLSARCSRAGEALDKAERALDALPADDASLVLRADETAAIETARFLLTRAAALESAAAAAAEAARCESLTAAILDRLAVPAAASGNRP